MEHNPKITVIDSLMGSGKSSWAIQYMRQHPEKSFIYVTPTLSEVSRIQKEVGTPEKKFYTPFNTGSGKTEGIRRLFQKGKDIACTHALFKLLTLDMIDLIQQGNYTVIIDEALNVFEVMTRSKKDDFRIMQQANLCSVDSGGYIVWNPNELHSESAFDELRNLALNHSLMRIDDTHLIWKYPPGIFHAAKEVFVLTYLFDGSTMKPYFEMEGMAYQTKGIVSVGNDYQVTDYTIPDTSQFQSLIQIYQNGKVSKQLNHPSLTKHWYQSASKEDIEILKKSIDNFYRNVTKSKSKEFLWTAYKNRKAGLKGKAKEVNFLPCNAKGTNDYASTCNLAYMVNRRFSPVEKRFYKQYGIQFDEDLWSLSEMLQWIWRSRIRNGEPITIYIPSDRMCGLLTGWLAGKTSM